MNARDVIIGVICVVFTLGFIGLGGVAAYTGVQQQETADAIGDTEKIDIEDIETGQVAVNGTAQPVAEGNTLTLPFDDSPVLAAHLKVEYADNQANSDSDNDYTKAFSASLSEPIRLDDGTGTVRVEPADSLAFPALVARSNEQRFADSDQLLDALEALAERRPEIDTEQIGQLREEQPKDSWRYTVRVIQPEQDVYVLGQANESTDTDDAFVIDDNTDSGVFVLSEFTRDQTQSRVSTGSRILVVVGIGFIVVGIVLPVGLILGRAL